MRRSPARGTASQACRPPRQVKQPGSAARSALPNQAANAVSAAFGRTRAACPPERPSSAAGAAEWPMRLEKQTCGPGLLQRLVRRYPLCTRREAARTAALTSGSGQLSRDTDPSTTTVGYATPDRHKTAAIIATDASTRITIRMEWYWSHLLRSLFQSPGRTVKSQAATRLLIGTRQISENGTVTASKAADDKHAHQDQLPLARVSNETTTKSNAAAYQNGMTLPNSRASSLAASA